MALCKWLELHMPHARLIALEAQRSSRAGADQHGSRPPCNVLVLDRPASTNCELLPRRVHGAHPPELVLVGVPHLVTSALQSHGFPLVLELRHPWCTETVGMAIMHSLSVRLPLRLLSRRAVGRVALKDALALVRFTC